MTGCRYRTENVFRSLILNCFNVMLPSPWPTSVTSSSKSFERIKSVAYKIWNNEFWQRMTNRGDKTMLLSIAKWFLNYNMTCILSPIWSNKTMLLSIAKWFLNMTCILSPMTSWNCYNFSQKLWEKKHKSQKRSKRFSTAGETNIFLFWPYLTINIQCCYE